MTPDREQQIRARAYEIWESEGRPDGKEAEHWERAAREVAERGDGQAEGGAHATNGAGPAGPIDAPPRTAGGPGLSTGLQPGGTTPGGGPAAGAGAMEADASASPGTAKRRSPTGTKRVKK